MIRLTSKELIETPKYKFADKLIKKAIEEYSPNIYYDYLGYKVYIREIFKIDDCYLSEHQFL